MAAFIDAQGATQQFEMSLDVVREACASAMSVRDFINSELTTDVEAYGDPFSQLCASEGIVLQPSRQHGLRSPTLAQALGGRTVLEAG
ncbi:MAG: hypothetical protein QG638_1156, partial [Pseudomonadota bacterium]|nr:hypothetical protein [Pseudomonadota bacterium]